MGKWSFEEGDSSTIAGDTSGYSNSGTFGDGTCTPGNGSCPNWYTTDECDLGFSGCLKFDGDDYVEVAPNSSLDMTKSITLVAWVKRMGPGGVNPDRGIFLAKQGNYLEARPDDLCMSLVIVSSKHKCAGNVKEGQWYHAAGTYDGKVYKIYVNGQVVFSQSYTGDITNSGGYPLYIGQHSGGGFLFNGFLDEVQIYSEALTLSQIRKLYAQGVISRAMAYR